MRENGIENVLDMVGLPLPDVYSADLSVFVLEAGIKILERGGVDLMYLSLTDYIQHKYGPGTPEINDFYMRLDNAFGRLADAGSGRGGHGGSRHERQVSARRLAERGLPQGRVGRAVR